MTPPVRKAWHKLARMSWNELRTRVGQEVAKRTEYALYRTGLGSRNERLLSGPRPIPKFFFSPDQISGRIALLRQHMPGTISATIDEADQILQHRFHLLGYTDLDYGKDIDWHLDAVHDKRAPLKPWYKIPFLDFDEVGDHKITWELNRHQHFLILAKARLFSGDEKYIREVVDQFYSWRSANPYPMGINWGSSLEVAFRSLSWLWVRQLLAGDPLLPAKFDEDLLRALAGNGRYIERYLSTYFSPNTHLIGEAVALFFIGTLCPEIAAAARWQKKGWSILLSEAERQVRPDGIYFEQSLYYHVYALDFFLHARALAASNGIEVTPKFDTILKKMLRVLHTLSLDGAPEGFGDDDGGRVFNPRRDRAEHMADPLTAGACIFDDDKLSAPLTEEAIWLFGSKAVGIDSKHKAKPALSSCAFPDGGIYILASSAERRGQMTIDAGPMGTARAGHGHADALSVSFSLNGRRCLIDPGSYVYISSGDERNQFRGTAAHNSLRVDAADQAIPDGPFAWRAIPDIRVAEWAAGKSFTFFSGYHTGYQRLASPVLHRRMIFHLHGEYWLVRDVIEGQGQHDLELFWHFATGVNLRTISGGILAESAGENLLLLSANSALWHTTVGDGKVSPAYGRLESAPMAVCSASTELPAEYATLISPQHVSAQGGRSAFAQVKGADPAAYACETENSKDLILFGNKQQPWSFGRFRSDASLLFVRTVEREITFLAFCSASLLEFDGRPVYSSSNAIDRLEWDRSFGAATSEPESLKFFDPDVFLSRTTVR